MAIRACRNGRSNLKACARSIQRAISPAGGGSEVEWIGRFYRGNTSNLPPENLNDEAATKAMTVFFREALDGLKKKLEGK